MTLRTAIFLVVLFGGLTLLGMWLVAAITQLAALAHFIRGDRGIMTDAIRTIVICGSILVCLSSAAAMLLFWLQARRVSDEPTEIGTDYLPAKASSSTDYQDGGW